MKSKNKTGGATNAPPEFAVGTFQNSKSAMAKNIRGPNGGYDVVCLAAAGSDTKAPEVTVVT